MIRTNFIISRIQYLTKVTKLDHKNDTFISTKLQVNPLTLLRIKLKCGLVCELTLRVNRHSKGQGSPLSHHYVF